MGVATMSPFDPRYPLVRAVALMRDRQKAYPNTTDPFFSELVRRAESEVDNLLAVMLEPQLPDIDAILAAQSAEELPTPFPFPIPELPEGGYQ